MAKLELMMTGLKEGLTRKALPGRLVNPYRVESGSRSTRTIHVKAMETLTVIRGHVQRNSPCSDGGSGRFIPD